jgi:hypothetical protein
MKNEIFVPIGVDCKPAHFLRGAGLRVEAYPFDWNVTPVHSALELISNGFDDFLCFKNLLFLKPAKRLLFEDNGVDLKITNEIITPVLCKRYGILFTHDFTSESYKDFTVVKSKYEHRIRRLKLQIANLNRLTFVFNLGSLNGWQKQQYQYAGYQFETASILDIKSHHARIEIPNSRLITLDMLCAQGHRNE